ncbi:MAG: putative negative regulator of RcsB-dependent stress response [Nitrospinales bacterium]|jgi:predicted negative regulator of RcsB-dependent stress response
MLSNHIRGKKTILSFFFIAVLSTSTVVRAEDEFQAMSNMVNLMDSFFGLMNSVYDMNADNEKAALLQMHAIEEIYKDQGRHKDAVAVYENVLKKSNNSTIRNIAYSRMADVLKESGDLEGSIKVLNNALAETLKKTN